MAKRRGNGEGCIYERKKGQWAAVVSDGINPKTGKTKRKFVYGKTREEVREKLRAIQNQQATGGIVDTGRLNLTTWLNTWCDAYAKPNIKQTTYESYKHLIRCHIIPEIGGILLKKLSTSDIQQFYAKMLQNGNKGKIQDPETGDMVERGDGLSPATVKYIHRVLNAALEQAREENRIAVNPAKVAKPPKVVQKEMKVLSQEQVGIFLGKSKDYRYYGAYVLAISSGMRRGEVLGLPWSDFTLDICSKPLSWKQLDKHIPYNKFDNITAWDATAIADILIEANVTFTMPCIRIAQQLSLVSGSPTITTPKTDNSVRQIEIPQETACILLYQRYLQLKEKKAVGKSYNPDDLVFCTCNGTPVPPRSFTRNFQGAVKHAGLEKIRFHDLRHTVATVLLEEGSTLNTVQKLLGHYDPAFTASQYGHVTKRMRSEATGKLSNLLSAAHPNAGHETERP